MYRKYVFLFMVLYFLYAPFSMAQKIIHGYVRDKKTGEPLPEANIQVIGTFSGTISNDDGKYILKLKKIPATILVSYIGYKSRRITVTEDSSTEQDISLVPTVIKLQAVVVTGEDPAVRIMRKVLERKKEWQSKLEVYKAEAYTRVTVENDTGIVSISESKSEVFWRKKKGLREVIKSKRETANIPREANFALAITLPNLYDDDIDVMGFKVAGPTNPNAFHFYKFKLVGQKSLNGKTVFDISVAPKGKLQPTFVGHIFVLDEAYALIKVDLEPSESIIFQPPIQGYTLHFKQQFSNFGREFWFPVDVRVRGSIKIGFVGFDVPNIKYNQISRLSDYQVNIQLPDTLFEKKRAVIVDSISVARDTSFASGPRIIPLTTRESKAYASLDSTMTLEKAFKPTGFLARFVDIQIGSDEREADLSNEKKKSKSILTGFRPPFHYNRVDAFHLGLKYKRNFIRNLTYYLTASYNTGLKRWSYGGGFTYYLDRKRKSVLEGNYSRGTDTRYSSENYSSLFNTAYTLLGNGDYFDYYWNKKLHLSFRYRFDRINTQLSVGWNNEEQSPVSKTTDFVLFGKNRFRPNPEIPAGRIASLEGSLVIGHPYVPFGVIGQRRIEFTFEHSFPNLLGSDFSFTSYKIAIDGHLNTFLRRRFLPNSIDFRLVAGTSTGKLPIQRFGSLDVRMGAFDPFGVFRTLTGQPLEGEKYFGFFWEHNFRTVPFELLGLRGLAKKGLGIIIHGAVGRTWISEERRSELNYQYQYLDHFHNEIGFSLNGLFGLLRFDVTKRLDEPGIFFGFGLARMF